MIAALHIDAGQPCVELGLGPEQLALRIHHGQGGRAELHSLPIGIETLAHAFDNRMPGVLALENGIAEVEDAVMPAAQWLPAQVQTLCTADPLLRQLVLSATGGPVHPGPQSAARDAIEHLFAVLVGQAEQGLHTGQAQPQDVQAAAALLILRECMHHWGMQQVQLLE
jgi:hypothetical protein